MRRHQVDLRCRLDARNASLAHSASCRDAVRLLCLPAVQAVSNGAVSRRSNVLLRSCKRGRRVTRSRAWMGTRHGYAVRR